MPLLSYIKGKVAVTKPRYSDCHSMAEALTSQPPKLDVIYLEALLDHLLLPSLKHLQFTSPRAPLITLVAFSTSKLSQTCLHAEKQLPNHLWQPHNHPVFRKKNRRQCRAQYRRQQLRKAGFPTLSSLFYYSYTRQHYFLALCTRRSHPPTRQRLRPTLRYTNPSNHRLKHPATLPPSRTCSTYTLSNLAGSGLHLRLFSSWLPTQSIPHNRAFNLSYDSP
jgi:hypothetical protein